MSMADEETFEWTKDLLLFHDLTRAVRKGGLTADERTDLAQKFGVSEDLLLRYERAKAAWNTLIFDKQWAQAGIEVGRRRRQLGIDILMSWAWGGNKRSVRQDPGRTPGAGEEDLARSR